MSFLLHKLFQPSCCRVEESSLATTARNEQDKIPLMLLACSSNSPRKLGADRKAFFDHLHFDRLTKSTIRVVMTQGATIMSAYMNDQLKADLDRDQLVVRGEMTRAEADLESEVWAEQEWEKRWVGFPRRLMDALAKYHATILVMRLYESIAANMTSEVMLDKLTMDTFAAPVRVSKEEGKVGAPLARDMLGTCWYGNLISYAADYTVHQVILLFGYYMYIQDQRRRSSQQSLETQGGKPQSGKNQSAMIHSGSLALSLFKKSTLLALSRLIGLAAASIGGAIGSYFWPGWGTLMGINMGDGLAYTFTDEMVNQASPIAPK